MKNMKYITYEGRYCPDIVIFPSAMEHNEMYSMLGTPEIIGAGFVDFESMKCFGESIGLKVTNHSDDTKLLRWHSGYTK